MALPVDARSQRIATIWLVAMTVVWGSTFFTAKMAIDAMGACASVRPVEIVQGSACFQNICGTFWGPRVSPALPPAVFMLLRFVLAAMVFPLFFPRAVMELSGRAARAALAMSIACVAGCLFQIVGLGMTTPSMSAFLTSLTVMFTPVMVFLCTRETPGRGLIVAIGLAVLGLGLLTNPTVGVGWGRGETLNLICAACFAVQIVMIDRFMRDLPVAGTTWLMLVFSGPLVACTLPFFQGWQRVVSTPWLLEAAASRDLVLTLAWLVLPGTVLAIWAVNRFQKDINPTRAAVIYTLEPVFAAIFSYCFYDEQFKRGMIVGAAILLAGNLVAELSKKKDAKLAAAGADS